MIHFNVWQNPLQYCKVISLQLIKNLKKEHYKSIVKIKISITEIITLICVTFAIRGIHFIFIDICLILIHVCVYVY